MKESKLIFLTGKMGAGKSTLSKELVKEENTVLLSEDEMLSAFYPNEIHNISDYIKYSKRLKPFLLEHIKQLTDLGLRVVLDFPGNTKKQREWFKTVIEHCMVEHTLIYIKKTDEECIKHIQKRREENPERQEFDTVEVFFNVTKYFEEPSTNEGFHIIIK